jgi:hypothetical protein
LEALGATSQDVQKISSDIRTLSGQLGVSSNALADASVKFKQLGLSARETGAALRAVGQASLAPTFGNVRQTAQSSAAGMKAFKLSAEQLAPTLNSI